VRKKDAEMLGRLVLGDGGSGKNCGQMCSRETQKEKVLQQNIL
jgi:hypothetical protein